jgi:enoyl-CoA hydratase/carnithine racemase
MFFAVKFGQPEISLGVIPGGGGDEIVHYSCIPFMV